MPHLIQEVIVYAARRLIGNSWFPGRYALSETVIRLVGAQTAVFAGQIGDYTLEFDFHDLLQRQMWFNLYDTHETRLVRELLEPGDVFFDVGANVGYYSFIASQQVGASGQVHAFEPIPRNVASLRRGIETNHIENIVINQLAIGETQGKLSIFLGDDDIGNTGWASIIQTKLKHRPFEVMMTSIDQYIAENRVGTVALIKLDIEGAEFEALKGMDNLLSGSAKPPLIIELNEFLLKQRGLPPGELLAYLKQRGYEFFLIGRQLKAINVNPTVKGVINVLCVPH